MPTQAPVHIGTSGWHYTHWRGPFYPDDLGADRFLAYYAARFPTVEINRAELLEVRLDRLFRKAEESRFLHVSLGCLQESLSASSLSGRESATPWGDRLHGKMEVGPASFLSVPLHGWSLGDFKRQSRGLRHKRHRF